MFKRETVFFASIAEASFVNDTPKDPSQPYRSTPLRQFVPSPSLRCALTCVTSRYTHVMRIFTFNVMEVNFNSLKILLVLATCDFSTI